MIISKVSKIKKFIILFNTINYYKNDRINVFIKDNNRVTQTWYTTLTDGDGGLIYNVTSHSAYMPLDHFPYARTNCVYFFSYDDEYGKGTKIIIISDSDAFSIKSHMIDLPSNNFYELILIH